MRGTSQQTAHVQISYIGETGRLISDILDISDKVNISEKAVDSPVHGFLLVVLRKFGFVNNFINWIKILTTNRESCVISGGTTTSYFKSKKEHIKMTQFPLIYLLLL